MKVELKAGKQLFETNDSNKTGMGLALLRNLLLRRSAKLRIRAALECPKVAFGCPEVASEVVTKLV